MSIELCKGVPLSKIAWRLSLGYGIRLADIARDLGVCTSAFAKAVRKMEGRV